VSIWATRSPECHGLRSVGSALAAGTEDVSSRGGLGSTTPTSSTARPRRASRSFCVERSGRVNLTATVGDRHVLGRS